MRRRNFVQFSAFAGFGLSLPIATLFSGYSAPQDHSAEYTCKKVTAITKMNNSIEGR